MKRVLITAVFVAMLPILGGCPWYWNHETMTLAWNPQYEPFDSEIEDARNTYNLERLLRGMTREDVYTIMGMPDLYGRYETVDRDYVSVFYYYTATQVDDGAAARNEVTPLVIRNGKLVGWGVEYLQSIPEYRQVRLKQP